MSLRKLINQKRSHTATTIALHSNSANDLETVCCFLDFQETKGMFGNCFFSFFSVFKNNFLFLRPKNLFGNSK